VSQSLVLKIASGTNAISEGSHGTSLESQLKMGSRFCLFGLKERNDEFHPSTRVIMGRNENEI
jgi:hypothetical protein